MNDYLAMGLGIGSVIIAMLLGMAAVIWAENRDQEDK